MWGTGRQRQDDADTRPEVSEQLFLHTILLEPFLSSKAGRRSRKSGEGQVSLSHTATELRAIPAARLKCPWPWPAGDSTDGSLGHLEILSKIGNRISTSRLWSLFPVRWTSLYHGIYVVTFHYPPALASSVSSGAQGWLRVSSPHPISFLMDGLPHSALPASVLPVTAHFLLLHCSRSAGQTEAVPWPFTHKPYRSLEVSSGHGHGPTIPTASPGHSSLPTRSC